MSQAIPPNTGSFGNGLLQDFHEISLPDPVSYMPETIGWLFLLAAIVLYALWQSIKAYKTWANNRYRRIALIHIQQLKQDTAPPIHVMAKLAVLLKATALQVFPRTHIAALSGEQWLSFLNQQTASPSFCEQSRDLLGSAQYRHNTRVSKQQLSQLIAESEYWVRRHKVPNVKLSVASPQHD